ncbi:MAG: reactive intermediate/imine deaminase [Candidatus Zixiibacteriota bacterium]|nr:MAG: reactive intermediate/imine deaminase [candidate division Zixibacteria bacterium]
MKKITRTDKAPEALGPYSQAVKCSSGIIFTAMQIGLDPGTGELKGNDIESQTRQAFVNLKNILEAAGSGFENVVKSTLYFTELSDFVKVNELYSEYFSKDFPARAAVEVTKLPKGALIGIEMVAE